MEPQRHRENRSEEKKESTATAGHKQQAILVF
jgi:hypothetical protein